MVALTHAIYPKLTPLLRARRETESHAIATTHATNNKSHCARLIQHIHWHHQILTKPNAQCCKTHTENPIRLSCHQQQITLCTAHSSQHGKFKRRRNQNEMLNEIGTRSRLCIWQPFPFFCPNHKLLGKNTMFHDFRKISRTRICLLLTLSLLCFSSVHIVGRLTPKFPLNIYISKSPA